MSDTLSCEAVARVLDEPKRSGKELLFRCPHPKRHKNGDEHPSLSVNPAENVWLCPVCLGQGKGGWSLAAFIAGIDANNKKEVAVWLRGKGLLPERKAKSKRGKPGERGPCVATYIYTDAGGNPVARKRRFEPGAGGRKKDFTWERWESGEWISGLGENGKQIQIPLYRSREISDESYVIAVEGEKDADAGAAIGLQTTTSGAAGSWRDDHSEALRGKAACVIADPDEPGRKHAQQIAASLYTHDIPVSVIELPGGCDLAEWIARGGTAEQVWELIAAAPEWRPASGAELLRRFEHAFSRYIISSKGMSLIGALYAFMTHCFEVFSWIAYLCFSSPLESCGKSHAADIVAWTSASPEIVVSITQAALFRLITKVKPTVVIDEAEVLRGDDETAVGLRAVLHAGNAPDDYIYRCAPNTHELEQFAPFCPKIFCAINGLDRVLASRCITIPMQRKKPSERVTAFIRRRVKEELVKLGAEIEVWVSAHEAEIRRVYESLPDDSFGERGGENFAPLETILRVADPSRLPELARARQMLTNGSDAYSPNDSMEVRLLTDIRTVFDEREVSELASKSLAEALAAIETSPWGEWSKGKPLSPAKLARLLDNFRVHPDRIGGKDSQVRGYAVAWFQDAFARYLPNKSVKVSTDRENTGENEDFESVNQAPVDTSENAVSTAKNAAGGHIDTLKQGVDGSENAQNGASTLESATCGENDENGELDTIFTDEGVMEI